MRRRRTVRRRRRPRRTYRTRRYNRRPTRRTFRKRRGYRPTLYSAGKTRVRRFPFLFPDRVQLKHTFTDMCTVSTLAATGFGSYLYNGNSVWDPQASQTTGSSAYLFEQMANWYYTFRVGASKIKCSAVNTRVTPFGTEGTIYPYIMFLRACRPTQIHSGTAPEHSMLDGMTKYRVMSSPIVGRFNTLSCYATTRRVCQATSKEYYPNSSFAGTYATDPQTMWVWQVGFQRYQDQGVLTAGEFVVMVTLTYYTIWSNRKITRTGAEGTLWNTAQDDDPDPVPAVEVGTPYFP